MHRLTSPMPRHLLAHGVYCALAFVACWIPAAHGAVVDSIDGIRLNITMREILQSDPPETTIVDTLGARLAFGQETTLRVGNSVIYVTARSADSARCKIEYGLFAPGPIPYQQTGAATIEYGVPLFIDGIRGKGKSVYRVLLVPHPARFPLLGISLPGDSSDWDVVTSVYYLFHVAPQSLAAFRFPGLQSILDHDYESAKDIFGFRPTDRPHYYFVEGLCADVPLDPRFDFAVDPSRDRIVARYDHAYTGVDAQAMLLLKLYRWWGYAPELLAIGASAYPSFSDFEVINDRDSGRAIALDSLAQTLWFKRQPFPASMHHAASFVRWLINTHDRNMFHDLYAKATDLSLPRAFWSVYGKTLKELEADWLAYLKTRRFAPGEFYLQAERAAAYRRYAEYYDLLLRAVRGDSDVVPRAYRELGLAAAQLGRWSESVDHFVQFLRRGPDDPPAINLLAEALWARGMTSDAEHHMKRLMAIDTTDARPYLLLGDMQQRQLRSDSATSLWRQGLRRAQPGPVALELYLRLGEGERFRHPDTAAAYFHRALAIARRLLEARGGEPLTIIRAGESYLQLDSIDIALEHFSLAADVCDSPQELGRIYLDVGRAHDLAHRRKDAVRAYELVFKLPATYNDHETARYYINHIYRH